MQIRVASALVHGRKRRWKPPRLKPSGAFGFHGWRRYVSTEISEARSRIWRRIARAIYIRFNADSTPGATGQGIRRAVDDLVVDGPPRPSINEAAGPGAPVQERAQSPVSLRRPSA